MYRGEAGQAPFQQPYTAGHVPQTYGQPAYGQPQYAPAPFYPPQYGQNPFQQHPPQAPPPAQNGPPHKKQRKSSAVVTRYATPATYDSAPAQPAYGHPGYPHAPNGYPAPAYSGPPAASGYGTVPHQYQGYNPQTAYHPQQVNPYAPQAPVATYHQPPYPAPSSYQPPQFQPPASTQAPPPAGAPWGAHHNGWQYGEAVVVPPVTELIRAEAQPRHASLDHSILDFDFESEVGLANEDVVPELSLGLIVWHPATPTNRPLPGTFKEAQRSRRARGDDRADDDECISKYHTGHRAHEYGLSIRQLDEWETVKNDSIFAEFPADCDVVPFLSMISNRDRPDLEPKVPIKEEVKQEEDDDEGGLPSPAQGLSASDNVAAPTVKVEVTENNADVDSDGDQAMDMSDSDDEGEPYVLQNAPRLLPSQPSQPSRVGPQSVSAPSQHGKQREKQPETRTTSVLDSLEDSLGPIEPLARQSVAPPMRGAGRHSRSKSPEKRGRSRQTSRQPGQIPKAKPAAGPRDAAQESILAALGVEGSPKMVFPTPPPARSPERSPERSNGQAHYNGYGHPSIISRPMPGNFSYRNNFQFGPNIPPPPPPQEARSPSYDPWKAHDAAPSPRSTTSQHTAAGSDFHHDKDDDDMDITPKAKSSQANGLGLERTGSGRKRSWDRMADRERETDGRIRQTDDTPRARRKPNYDRTDAYSRRW